MKSLPITQAGVSSIIRDYLLRKPSLQFAYERFPTKENYLLQGKEKLKTYSHREIMCRVLSKQNQSPTAKQAENLALFSQENTVTITTGHQLNLATGPLYFLYKILHTVKLCDALNQTQQEINFVPIYWMATEDHDFEEINHFNTYENSYQWEGQNQGAVGQRETQSLYNLVEVILKDLPENENGKELRQWLRESYQGEATLSQATRAFVQRLLGAFGILILDADCRELKELAIPYFRREIEEQLGQKKVKQTNEKLQGYKNQAFARDVNLFYLSEGKRGRIAYNGKKFGSSVHEKLFTKAQILEELQQFPQRFSPNVILRPLYQEVILPNVAYVGGAGEIAYWLQLKSMFEAFEVKFPMLVVRNSLLIIPENIRRKAEKFGLKTENLFAPKEVLVKEWIEKQSKLFEEIEALKHSLKDYFSEAENIAGEVHSSYIQMLEAQKARQMKGFEKMKKKLYTAEKKRLQDKIQRFYALHQYLFPRGTWQERKINFMPYYLEEGKALFEKIYKAITPFEYNFIILPIGGVQQK